MESTLTEKDGFPDLIKMGYLRKPKSMRKRFFVLRAASTTGPSRLEYYDNEKKWRQKSGMPKRSIPLESCFNINKRADSKNKHLVALYTKDEYFAVAADSEQEQDSWYEVLVDLHNKGKVHESVKSSDTRKECYGDITPGPAFKEVWQVILKSKGLGQVKNLIGVYRLCLTNKTLGFVKLNSDAAAVVLQLTNIRRCGHSENFFFIEVGRSAITGPGEFWMQVDDSVVAQNMHETILEAMKAMSEEFGARNRSHSSSNCSNPISVPLRTRHHNNNPPPREVGLGRCSRAESVTATSPAGPKHSHSFRVRAASDGEGTMSRPASLDCTSSSPRSRHQSQRYKGGTRLHPPLNHSKSIPVHSSRCSPSTTSQFSLSSSSTSGHGSTSEYIFPRRSSVSASGSPSDGSFISSDEYGSSPCDFPSSFRSVTPDSLGHTPPAREEKLNHYIYMAKPGSLTSTACQLQCQSEEPPNLDDPDLETCFRKRSHSSGTPPPTICHQKTPSLLSVYDYAVMTSTHPHSKSASSPLNHLNSHMATGSNPEDCLDMSAAESVCEVNNKDDGYMPMSPGSAPDGVTKKSDYMPMSPKSISAPQQIINPRQQSRVDSNGYMMMSPSESSPDISTNFPKFWVNGTNLKLSAESTEGKISSGGDYMNISPLTTGTSPDWTCSVADEPPRLMYTYFSLPRSFKHTNKKQDQSPLRNTLDPTCQSYAESSSSSASSDSLGGQCCSKLSAIKPKVSEVNTRFARPTKLDLDTYKASTLPRMREIPFLPEPKSPGEYVNIKFNDRAVSCSLTSVFLPTVISNVTDAERSSSDYMNMQLGSQSSISNCEMLPLNLTNSAPPQTVESISEHDYMSMQLDNSCSRDSNSQMMLKTTSLDSEIPPCSASPSEGVSTLGVPNGSPIVSLSGTGFFSWINSAPMINEGAKVIRAIPQGRRRHSSETFVSTAKVGLVRDVCSEAVKRHSSASIENFWLKPTDDTGSVLAANASITCNDTSQNTKGLNYIDLDLAQNKKSLFEDWSLFHSRQMELGAMSQLEGQSAYASIHFQETEKGGGNVCTREE